MRLIIAYNLHNCYLIKNPGYRKEISFLSPFLMIQNYLVPSKQKVRNTKQAKETDKS